MNSSPSAGPRFFLTNAVGFIEAARHIRSGGPMFHWPAFLVNVCYALELAPKAFILDRGIATQDQLRGKYGHKLIAAYCTACDAGYEPPDRQIEEVLKLLDPLHRRHSLRYLESSGVILPDPDQTLTVATAYVHSIGMQINVEHLD